MQAASAPGAGFEVSAVVSQPGKPKGRGNKAVPIPSPVEQLARSSGLPDERILCPKSAKEAAFLDALSSLQPDLCVTAAYGNMLPTAFLAIPKYGTLNIHPSLLPQYRGAAPVQRAVQDGVVESGVSVAFTVLRCDAGPVLAQRRVAVAEDEQAPELLARLFSLGAELLLEVLDQVWDGRAASAAWQQEEAAATHAAKLSKEEALLDFKRPAHELHNQVRAFAGWPGTLAELRVTAPATAPAAASSSSSSSNERVVGDVVQVKLLRTRVVSASEVVDAGGSWASGAAVWLEDGRRLLLPCGCGDWLEVLQLQPLAKRAMSPRDFGNGLGGRKLLLAAAPAAAAGVAAGAAAAGRGK